ncbi:hypothetical protein [Myxacorys almedinensis]|nr:hypothetical protein [Myxacorys almedinensis]
MGGWVISLYPFTPLPPQLKVDNLLGLRIGQAVARVEYAAHFSEAKVFIPPAFYLRSDPP